MIDVYLEIGKKRVFASATDWPGWSRSGKTEADALAALEAYAPRYAPVARLAGVKFPSRLDFRVVERVQGSASTEFGVPGEVAAADAEKTTPAARKRLAALVEAAWKTFDAVVAKAPAELRKGPRGGGRDRDKIHAHVTDAEGGYQRMLDVRIDDPAARRAALLEAIRSGQTRKEGKSWPTPYAARRIAWHALDHAWEIEDRSEK